MTQQPADAMPKPRLPCPFCGSGAVLMDHAAGRIFCMLCLAQGPRDLDWNSRPPPLSAETVEKIREAKRLLEPFKSYGDGVAQAVAYRLLNEIKDGI